MPPSINNKQLNLPITTQEFLSQYWHKQPLLIKNGIKQWSNPISADELAGLALDDNIDSRLIQYDKKSDQYHTEHGPFDEQYFDGLNDSHWSLLVQSVDHYEPAVVEILDYFNFLPQWLIDDIMVSYACTGGGVGAHFDRYDVFLIQGSGKREWQIGQICDDNTPLKSTDSNLLKHFIKQQSFVLDAGDILYLPPYLAHWGVALDDECMTYSVGFRAPSHSQMITSFSEFIAEQLSADQRLQIFNPKPSDTGAIPNETIKRISHTIQSLTQDNHLIQQWFGCWISQSENNDDEFDYQNLNNSDLKSLLSSHVAINKHPAIRFYFIEDDDNFLLFINGVEYAYNTAKIDKTIINDCKRLCNQRCFNSSDLYRLLINSSTSEWLLDCFNNDYLQLVDD